MVRKHTSAYKPSYTLQYDVSIISRTPVGPIDAVQCHFCVTFGIQQNEFGKVTRMIKQHRKDIITWSAKNWRADMFTQHHLVRHKRKWDKYVHFTDDEKNKFLNIDVSFAKTIRSHFEASEKRL